MLKCCDTNPVQLHAPGDGLLAKSISLLRRDQRGQSWAGKIGPFAHSGRQSGYGIRFILSARGASHIIRYSNASRLLVVCIFSYGPTSVKGKRTHNCGIDEKGLGRVSSQSLLPLSSRRSRPISTEKQTASSL